MQNKRAELEQAIKAKAEEKSLHDAVDRNVSRLVPLVRDAEELRHNAEAVPTQYAPKAEELKKEVEAAKAIIANAPASDDHVQQLQQVVATAETLIRTSSREPVSGTNSLSLATTSMLSLKDSNNHWMQSLPSQNDQLKKPLKTLKT